MKGPLARTKLGRGRRMCNLVRYASMAQKVTLLDWVQQRHSTNLIVEREVVGLYKRTLWTVRRVNIPKGNRRQDPQAVNNHAFAGAFAENFVHDRNEDEA